MTALLTLKDLKHEFRLCNDGDSWGNAMQFAFAICDECYFNRPDLSSIPALFDYRPSPLGPSNDEDELLTEIVQNASDDALEAFAPVLNRYIDKLRAAGKDY